MWNKPTKNPPSLSRAADKLTLMSAPLSVEKCSDSEEKDRCQKGSDYSSSHATLTEAGILRCCVLHGSRVQVRLLRIFFSLGTASTGRRSCRDLLPRLALARSLALSLSLSLSLPLSLSLVSFFFYLFLSSSCCQFGRIVSRVRGTCGLDFARMKPATPCGDVTLLRDCTRYIGFYLPLNTSSSSLFPFSSLFFFFFSSPFTSAIDQIRK